MRQGTGTVGEIRFTTPRRYRRYRPAAASSGLSGVWMYVNVQYVHYEKIERGKELRQVLAAICLREGPSHSYLCKLMGVFSDHPDNSDKATGDDVQGFGSQSRNEVPTRLRQYQHNN